MSDQYSEVAASAICHAADMVKQSWQQAAGEWERPCILFKPKLSRDGNKWCALFGDNLQDGVAGFGDTPAAAMWAFDAAWFDPLGSHISEAKEQPQ